MPSATVTIRVSKEEAERLRKLAATTRRTVSYLGHEAIVRYLETEEWQLNAIQESLAALDAGEPTIEHEALMAYLRSLATENPLPKPY